MRDPKPTAADGQRALRDHAIGRAQLARQKYGEIDSAALQRLLSDPEFVRFPTRIEFDASELLAGEFAHVVVAGEKPSDGYRVLVHPSFESQPDVIPYLVAYHLVRVNYGDMATAEVAELFGAALLGIEVEDYYQTLCRIADELAGDGRTPCPGA